MCYLVNKVFMLIKEGAAQLFLIRKRILFKTKVIKKNKFLLKRSIEFARPVHMGIQHNASILFECSCSYPDIVSICDNIC